MPTPMLPGRGHREWGGRVYNPRVELEKQIENKRQMSRNDFDKTQKPALLRRFDSIEGAIGDLAKAIKERFEILESEVAHLKGKKSKNKEVVESEDEG